MHSLLAGQPTRYVQPVLYGTQDTTQAQRAQDDQQTQHPDSGNASQHAHNHLDDELGSASSVDDVFAIIQKQGPSFTDCNCVTALQRLAALKDDGARITDHATFPALVDMIMAAAATFTPHEHTQLIAAAGALRVQDQNLLDGLARQLMEHVQRMQASELEHLATGLARAGHSPSVALFDAVRARAQEVGVGGEQANALRNAFKALDYRFD